MKAAVSVIVPCYNQAHYLWWALRSVLAQTFPDWEVIVVNDGSTDDTARVAGQFDDPRISSIHQENQGLSAARNSGIRAAQGKYLAFLDADDEWEPEFLRRCVPVLEADGTLAGVFTRNTFIDPQENILPQIGGEMVSRAASGSRNWEGGFFPVHAAVVRTDVVREVGSFDTKLTSEEDWDLWLRITQKYQMEGLPEPLARYRVYPGSMSTNMARMHANRMLILTKYLGPPEGDSSAWPDVKRRAYACAYRTTCIGYLQRSQPDEGWCFLAQAAAVWPAILRRLDTFYELVCGGETWGYRGLTDSLDISGSGDDLFKRLEALFAQASPAVRQERRAAYGNAYLALGILNDRAGHWAEARSCLLRAMAADPGSLISYPVVRRLVKLCAGKRLVSAMRSLGPGQPTRIIRVKGEKDEPIGY